MDDEDEIIYKKLIEAEHPASDVQSEELSEQSDQFEKQEPSIGHALSDDTSTEHTEDNKPFQEDKPDFTVGYQKVEDFKDQTPAAKAESNAASETMIDAAKNYKQAMFSKVAASTSNKRIQIIVALIVLVLTVKYIHGLMQADELAKDPEIKKKQALEDRKADVLRDATQLTPQAPQAEVKIDLSAASQKLPEMPQIVAPQAPEPPPPPTPVTPSLPLFPQQQLALSPSAAGAPPISFPGAAPSAPTLGGSERTSNTLQNTLLGKDVDEERKQKLLERRRASSLIVGGGGASSHDADGKAIDKKDAKKDNSDFKGFGDGSLDASQIPKTAAAQVGVTTVGDLSSIILQGKIMHAVLETAINTDLPGKLRAIITRDIYAENGKAVLIPKGSRIVGTYATALKPGQSRIGIIWERLIRPDGIDMAISFDGVDQVGRSGVEGFLDNKFWTQMGLAVLTSYIIPVVAQHIANVKDGSVTTTTNTGAGPGTGSAAAGAAITTTATAGSQQLQQSSQSFQQVATDAIKNSINTNPTVIIDQGTRINIFVNKDLVFPKSIALKSINKMK